MVLVTYCPRLYIQEIKYNIIALNAMADCCAAIIVTLLTLVATVQAAPHNCSVRHQAALQQVIYLRERYNEASNVYEDCCEVNNFFMKIEFLAWLDSSVHAEYNGERKTLITSLDMAIFVNSG